MWVLATTHDLCWSEILFIYRYILCRVSTVKNWLDAFFKLVHIRFCISIKSEFLKTRWNRYRMITWINAPRREIEQSIALDFSDFLTKVFLHPPEICLWWRTVPESKNLLRFAVPGCLTLLVLLFADFLGIYQHSNADISLFSRLYCFNPSPFPLFLLLARFTCSCKNTEELIF